MASSWGAFQFDMENKNRSHPWKLFALYSGLIFLIPSCLAVGYFIGSSLDFYLGTQPWMLLLFLLLGSAAAFVQVFRVLNKKL